MGKNKIIKNIDNIKYILFDKTFILLLLTISLTILVSSAFPELLYVYLFISVIFSFASLFFMGATRELSINDLNFIGNDVYLSKEFKKFLNKDGTRVKIGFFFSLKKYKNNIIKNEDDIIINKIKNIGR